MSSEAAMASPLPLSDHQGNEDTPLDAVQRTYPSHTDLYRLNVTDSTSTQIRPVHDDENDEDQYFECRSTSAQSLPKPDVFGAQIMQGILDATSGRRPLSQIDRHLTPDVREHLERRCHLARRLTRLRTAATFPSIVKSVAVCTPLDGVAELSFTVSNFERTRATAMRLESIDERWRVTALVLG